MKEFKKYKNFTRDVWGLGKFITRTLNELSELHNKGNVKVDYLANFMSNEDAKEWMTQVLNSDPDQRPSYDQFLQLKVFKEDPFCHIMLFFDDLRLRQSHEKEAFFRSLLQQTNLIPLQLCKKRILPRMLTLSFVTEPFASHFLPYLFTLQPDGEQTPTTPNSRPIGLLNQEDYMTYVVPFIRKCYQSRNLSLRIRILQNLEYYLWAIPADVISSEIISEVLAGLRDQDDDLVMFTMNGLVLLAKFLARIDQRSNSTDGTGVNIVNENFLKKLHHHCAMSKNIAVRSHALLCMMEMWSLPRIRKDIILSGLHMAIFDTDSYEIKLHALNVVLVHLQRFDPRELVSLVLKIILPLLLHERAEVRSKANQVFRTALTHIGETDLTHSNFGMVSRQDKPHALINVEPHFPPENAQTIYSSVMFTGSGPKVSYSFPGTGIVTLDNNNDEDYPAVVSPKTASREKAQLWRPQENTATTIVTTSPPPKRKTSNPTPPTTVLAPTPAPVQVQKEVVPEIPQTVDNEEAEDWDKWEEKEEKEDIRQPSPSKDTFEQPQYTPPLPVQENLIPSELSDKKKKKGMGVPDEEDDEPIKQIEQESGVDFFSELGMDVPSVPVVAPKKTKKVIVKKMVKKMVPVTSPKQATPPPTPPPQVEEEEEPAQASKVLEEDIVGDLDTTQSWGGEDLGLSLDFPLDANTDIQETNDQITNDQTTNVVDVAPNAAPITEETTELPEQQQEQQPAKKTKKIKKKVKVMVKKEK
jgi:hypothetical protein